MSKKEFEKEIEKLVTESKAEITITSDGFTGGCRLNGTFNPINALAMMNSAINALANAINLDPDELLEMRSACMSDIVGDGNALGIDLGAMLAYLYHLDKKGEKNEQK